MPRAIRNPSNAIIEVLSEKGKATWAELLKETQLSKGALSTYVTELLNSKKIKIQTDTSRRPPKTIYVLEDPTKELRNNLNRKKHPLFFNIDYLQEPDYSNPDYVAFAIHVGNLISSMKDRDKARQLMKEYLEFVMNYLLSDILAGIILAYSLSHPMKAIPQNSPLNLSRGGDKPEDILKIWKETRQHLDEDAVIQAIFWSAFKNKDITLEGKDAVFNSFFQEIEKKIGLSFMQRFIDNVARVEKDNEASAQQ
jgi:hypothetical protein